MDDAEDAQLVCIYHYGATLASSMLYHTRGWGCSIVPFRSRFFQNQLEDGHNELHPFFFKCYYLISVGLIGKNTATNMQFTMKKFISVFFIAMMFCTVASASDKSDKIKPRWVSTSIPESKSNTYIFERAYAEGGTLDEARLKALQNLSMRLEKEHNLHLNSNDLNSKEVCRTVDEYWVRKDGVVKIYVLYTIPKYMLPGYTGKLGNSYDDEIKVTTNYGARGFLSIVPGVGQMYKGSTGKGVFFLSVEIASAVGIVLCENNRATYVNKSIEQPKFKKEYIERANNWETGRNIAIGVAGAVYVWNLIDAFVAKGGKRIVVKKNSANLSVSPVATSNGAGVGVKLNF